MSLPADLLEKVDAAARHEYRNRSELIREAVRKYIQDVEMWEEIFRYGKQRARKLGITSERQVNQIVWNYRHKRK